jgi:hypothetical protein
LEAAVSESIRPSLVIWDKLLVEQRQTLVRTLGEMALRQVRQAPIIEETPGDEQRTRLGTPRHAA